MTIHLPSNIERSINAAVQSGRFPSVDAAVTAAWTAFNEQQEQGRQMPQTSEVEATPPPPAAPAEKPIWEVIDELRKSVPPEEFLKLPKDGAEQLDHYIYGSPKRPTA